MILGHHSNFYTMSITLCQGFLQRHRNIWHLRFLNTLNKSVKIPNSLMYWLRIFSTPLKDGASMFGVSGLSSWKSYQEFQSGWRLNVTWLPPKVNLKQETEFLPIKIGKEQKSSKLKPDSLAKDIGSTTLRKWTITA